MCDRDVIKKNNILEQGRLEGVEKGERWKIRKAAKVRNDEVMII